MSESKFDIYIQAVLRQVHINKSITLNAKSQLNYFLYLLASRLTEEATYLTSGRIFEMKGKKGKSSVVRKTISSRDIQSAVRLVLPGELARYAISEGTRAVTRFMSVGEGEDSRSRSGRARLKFSVSKVETIMRKVSRMRIGSGAPIYLAAVLEYMTAEILDLAGNFDDRHTRITNSDVRKAIENDEELVKLVETIDFKIVGGGQDPHVHRTVSARVEATINKKLSRKRSRRRKRTKSSSKRGRKRTKSRRGAGKSKEKKSTSTGPRCSDEDDVEPISLEPLNEIPESELYRASDSKCYRKENLRAWFTQLSRRGLPLTLPTSRLVASKKDLKGVGFKKSR